jgi:NAD(P)-dependent dehydrogenase (short-subunit alcohol dehydrogenase family)
MLICGIVASIQQEKFQPMIKTVEARFPVDWGHMLIVALILICAIVANILVSFPAAGVWIAILAGALFRKTAWHELAGATKGSLFFVALVFCSSMMPVETLPMPTWQSTFGIGLISAFAGTIPFTKLALVQGGYDWGYVAYAVGFGGSIIWFGSSAGMALANMFPECRSVRSWLRHGWYVPVAYAIGFAVMLLFLSWHPLVLHK